MKDYFYYTSRFRAIIFVLSLMLSTSWIFAQADNPCSATALTVNTSCTYTGGTNAGATASPGVPAPGCASYLGGDVWYTVTVPASGSITLETGLGGVITDSGMAIYSGSCAALALVACNDDGGPGAMSLIALTGQTPGATLWVRVWEYGNNGNGTFNICAYGPAPPPPGLANDDCSGAIPITANASCINTAGTNATATASVGVPAPGCANYLGGDVWYSVVVPAGGNVQIETTAGVITDGGLAVYSGTCGSLTLISCDDDGGVGLMSLLTINGQTPGSTLYIRVWEYGNDSNGSFSLCATIPPPPPPAPANDNCIGAYPTTVNAGGCTSQTAGTLVGGTPSIQDVNACFGSENDDVWFSFVAPASGSVGISLNNVVGSTTDLHHSLWSGTCPTLTLVPGSCSDPNTSTNLSLTPGATYFLRVNSYGSLAETTTFDVCIQALTVCGGASNNDWCQAPAILSSGVGTFSASTSSIFTSDTPANLNAIFCGSTENNSWYEFVATSATATFNFASVTNCFSGIQAQVFQVTNDVNGCCTNFTSFSNCYNPGTATPGVVTATGLTIGTTYTLMVDGFAGDQCDFQVSNWLASGILPVELIGFYGVAMPQQNRLNWQTASELNNDYFRVLRSLDGETFERIGIVDGAGNSTSNLTYQFDDRDIRSGTTYYQLEQVDFDGSIVKSETIALQRDYNQTGLIGIWPNPTTGMLTIELNTSDPITTPYVELLDVKGHTLIQELIQMEGFDTLTMDVSHLNSGIYFVRFIDENGVTTLKKIIKQ